ncbi:hypothetical protein [Spiroplasma endosymbiont of Diplazon laetatorius]|uniref:ABC transporter permease n=1 Tax=Spiroplasma endosymbiont of Diplazon laetatorius TaxID=3066322 RepID=UPI0030CDFCBD
MSENKILENNPQVESTVDVIKKFKKQKAQSKVQDYEKVNWMNFWIILKINLKNTFKSTALLTAGILFVAVNVILTLTMYFVNGENGKINYSVFSILISIQYISGILLLSIFISMLCIYLMRLHKTTGIQNIELRSGISPSISFLVRILVILIAVLSYVSINFILNTLISLGIKFEKNNGMSILLSSLGFWYLYGLLFASIAMLISQVISFFAATATMIVLSLTFSTAPVLTNLANGIGSVDKTVKQKEKIYKMYPNLNAGQYFYNILSESEPSNILSGLLSDRNFFATIEKNIGSVFFGDTDKVISFEDFSTDSVPTYIYDANALLEFLIQTGNYNVKLTSEMNNKVLSMEQYLLQGTSIFRLLEDMRLRLENSNFEDTQENAFIIKNGNKTKFVKTDIDPAIEVLKESYGENNAAMQKFLNLVAAQKKQLDIYDSVLNTGEKIIYDGFEPQFYRVGGSVMPMFKYETENNGLKFEYSNGKPLDASMQMISYITLQLYKDLFMPANKVDSTFDIHSFINQKNEEWTLNSSSTGYNVYNMLNIFNHPVLVFLSGESSPMTWNYLYEEFSLINRFSLVDFKVNIRYSAWENLYIKENANPNLNKPNKTTSESILFAPQKGNEKEDQVKLQYNIKVFGIVIWYMVVACGLFGASYWQYLKRARY